MTITDPPSLRDRLRRETAQAHAQVDALFGSDDFATRDGYIGFLARQAIAWETLRPILDSSSLARSDALREDLARLGSVVPGPVAGDLPEPMSLGHRYVLEGSRLGSILLSRLLAERSPDLARRANAYLTESAKIEPWKRLSATLQKMPEDHASGGLAVADALAMFDLFERAWHHGASLRGEANSAD